MKRTIIARFEIDDYDKIEQELFDSLQCSSLKEFTKLSDTNELYETDTVFRQLCMKVKAAKRYRDDYINKAKLKNDE